MRALHGKQPYELYRAREEGDSPRGGQLSFPQIRHLPCIVERLYEMPTMCLTASSVFCGKQSYTEL